MTQLPETHLMLRNTVREFVDKELKPFAGEIDKSSKYPRKQVSIQ